MSEQQLRAPEQLTSNDDIAELERVFGWMERIDDAYESGSHGPSVSELIVAMKADCDPDVIAAVAEARRRDARSHLKGQAQ